MKNQKSQFAIDVLHHFLCQLNNEEIEEIRTQLINYKKPEIKKYIVNISSLSNRTQEIIEESKLQYFIDMFLKDDKFTKIIIDKK